MARWENRPDHISENSFVQGKILLKTKENFMESCGFYYYFVVVVFLAARRPNTHPLLETL